MESSKIEKAIEYAKKYHKDQKRLCGEGYFAHSYRVYKMLKKEGVSDERILVTALLHQIAQDEENSPNALKDVEQEFGPEIVKSLKSYKKLADYKIKRQTPKHFNEEYVIQTFLNISEDLDSLIIRLADRTDNVKTSYAFSKNDRERIAYRSLNIYSPIARFLGLSGFVKEMEDEAFKIINSAEYYKIKKHIKEITPEIKIFLEDTEGFLKELLHEEGIDPIIESRIKGLYSIYSKNQRYLQKNVNEKTDFSHIYDIVAMRILVGDVEECYIVDGLLQKLWNSISGQRDDYIANPKPSGYKSIHNAFQASPNFNLEVQIKTHEMHENNEYGFASHHFYKTGEKLKSKLKEDPSWLKKINYWEDEYSFGASNIKENSKNKPFSNKIYVFSPLGDIYELKRDATVLDFAYAVHVEVGNSCKGGKVNGTIAKLSDTLNDGDIVEILKTRGKGVPSRDWLEFASTKKAQSEIRKGLRSAGRY